MNFLEYQKQAITTRIYSPKVALSYVVLGLMGETGEFMEKAALAQNEDSKERLLLLRREVGDMAWYLAAIHKEFELPEVIDFPLPSEDLEICTEAPFRIVINIGAVSEQVKKYLRDDWKEGEETQISEERRAKIFIAWKACLQDWVNILHVSNFDLQETLQENLDKLAKRKVEGKIQGSGDFR